MDIFENRGPEEIRMIYEDTIDLRVSCDSTCVFHHLCPLTKFNSGGRRCPAQNLDPNDKLRLINLFFMGDEGIKAEVLKSIFQLGKVLDLEGDPKHILQYIDVLVKASKTYYQEKAKVPTKPIDLAVSITTVGKTPDYIDITPEGGEDPETLLNSPVVDQIMAEYREKE